MLGKRPHQIQRTTSMSQLRVPPGARPRTPTRDFVQKVRKPVDAHPPTLAHQEALHLEAEPPLASSLHVDALSPMIHAHTGPLQSSSSWMSPPLLTKHLIFESFLDVCYSCKKPLGHGRDTFMYRGDAAFCSEDCRLRQIAYDDERRQKCLMSSSQGTSHVNHMGTPNTATITASLGAF